MKNSWWERPLKDLRSVGLPQKCLLRRSSRVNLVQPAMSYCHSRFIFTKQSQSFSSSTLRIPRSVLSHEGHDKIPVKFSKLLMDLKTHTHITELPQRNQFLSLRFQEMNFKLRCTRSWVNTQLIFTWSQSTSDSVTSTPFMPPSVPAQGLGKWEWGWIKSLGEMMHWSQTGDRQVSDHSKKWWKNNPPDSLKAL